MGKEISDKKRQDVYSKYGGRCSYCGIKLKYENMQVDHIIPKLRGYNNSELKKYGRVKGTNDISNLNPSCASCNSSKSTFTLEKWREQIITKHARLLRDNSNYRIMHRFKMISVKKSVVFYFEKVK